MNQASKKRKFPKKFVYIILYLIVLPIIAFSTLFISTYNNNKPALFTTTNDQGESYTPKIVKLSKIDSFSFDFACTAYNEPQFDEEGKVKQSTTMNFRGKAYGKKEGITISDLTYKVVMASKWVGYQSNASSARSLTIVAKDSDTYGTTSISGFNFQYPAKKLLFITIKTPTVYVMLSWTETDVTGKSTKRAYFIEYSYDEYFVEGLTTGGITAK